MLINTQHTPHRGPVRSAGGLGVGYCRMLTHNKPSHQVSIIYPGIFYGGAHKESKITTIPSGKVFIYLFMHTKVLRYVRLPGTGSTYYPARYYRGYLS